jgi:hypothetical protein
VFLVLFERRALPPPQRRSCDGSRRWRTSGLARHLNRRGALLWVLPTPLSLRGDKGAAIGDPRKRGIVPRKRRRASQWSIHARFGTYCLFEHLIDARLRERNVGLSAR